MTVWSGSTCLGETPTPEKPAETVLNRVRAQLPQTPLLIEGELHVRRPRGVPVQDLRFQLLVRWGDRPSRAVYTILTPEETVLERLRVVRDRNGRTDYTYETGSPPQRAPLDRIGDTIRKTDLSWVDLTLSFLWWPDGELVGSDELRGRHAFVINLPAPENTLADDYKNVKVWIDKQAYMLLRAEGYGPDGTLLKRLWVDSFKKIDDRWMVKDMEVEAYPRTHRTRLRVNAVRELSDDKENLDE